MIIRKIETLPLLCRLQKFEPITKGVMISVHYVELVWMRLYIDMIYGTLNRSRFRRLSLREVDDLWSRADDGFDVFPFDILGFSESTLKILYLFLRTPKGTERIRNWVDDWGIDVCPYPEPLYLVPPNRVLTLPDDGRFFRNRAPPRPPCALRRIIRRG